MDWLGKRNGELLTLMVSNEFDGLVTIDKNLQYQQNLLRFPIHLFILHAPNNRIDTLVPYMNKLDVVLQRPLSGQITIINLD